MLHCIQDCQEIQPIWQALMFSSKPNFFTGLYHNVPRECHDRRQQEKYLIELPPIFIMGKKSKKPFNFAKTDLLKGLNSGVYLCTGNS